MPIELGIWRLGDEPERISPTSLEAEVMLEEFLEADATLLDEDLLIIGRQVITDYGKKIDLLGVDRQGELVVIELKRRRTPREVVAQLLDYGSWVKDLSHDDVTSLYEEYAHNTVEDLPSRFESAFSDCFEDSPPDTLNESHRLVVVASELDESTERIVDYLVDEFGVPINVVFFQTFQDEQTRYVTRTWLRDPKDVESAASTRRGRAKREPWNGRDFYVAFGEDSQRSWEDAVRYGFVSAGGGRLYSGKLDSLSEGSRVFVHIPGAGYVGVGTVTGKSSPVTEFMVEYEGNEHHIKEVPLTAANVMDRADDPAMAEYYVPVSWEDTVPREEAVWEKGMFANQNVVCKLRNRFTIERLSDHFDWED